jgi:hypothetical protein
MSSIIAFTCRRCGHCCLGEGGIVLSAFDIERLSGHLELAPADMLARYAEHVGGKYRLTTGHNHYCIFYKEGCAIHPARPDICRAWPYFRGNIIDADSLTMAAGDCPGINRQASHAEFARQGRAYLDSRGLGRKRGADVPEALADIPSEQPEETDHGRPGFDAS